MLRIGQVETTATSDDKYTDGSVAGGVAATRLRAAAFNAIQEELANIVESAGLTLSIDDQTQVLTGLKKLFLSRLNPFADIATDGAAAIATALANLGLGDIALAGVSSGTLGTGGYISTPMIINGVKSNFIKQWGTTTISLTVSQNAVEGNTSITFPTAFPNEAVSLQASVLTDVIGGTCETCRPTSLSTTGAVLRGMSISSNSGSSPTAGTVTVYWEATGY